ncbi:MAG: metallophosphoesterase family protein, partial [Acholeplasmatales bacterium]|nr:metallophosphoesterase family protein [Acholeplasmatales bacterium]
NKIYFTHGHMYNVKMTYNTIIYKASSLDASICLFGHTHNPDVFLIDNILFLNPGSYADGFYAIIEDDSVSIFLYNKIYKKINYKW